MTLDIHPEQVRIFRTMSPEQKLDLALRLYHSARGLKASALRQRHSDWDEEEVQAKRREIFLYART